MSGQPLPRLTRARLGACLLALATVVGCAQPAQTGSPSESLTATRPQRPLVIASFGEPENFAPKFGGSGGQAGGGGGTGLMKEDLTGRDARAVTVPKLALELPRLNTDTWRVLPDGTMETVYKLRPNLTWHDGVPLSAQDFVFNWRVVTIPETGANPQPQNLMDDVVAVDEQTVLFKWKQPTILASQLGGGRGGFEPLPRHLLQEAWERGEPRTFLSHPYFRLQYVGLGPYRLERWEPGAFIEGRAFDGYALGRPRIDQVRIIFINNQDAVLANLLAGNAHILGSTSALSFTQGITLKRAWDAEGIGIVSPTPSDLRYIQVQFNPATQNPRAISDVRVRRALTHAIDRPGLAEGMLQEAGKINEIYLPPMHPYYDEANRVATKYPYDPRRTEQILAEAGIVKGSAGQYQERGGDAFHIVLQGDVEREILIITDSLRRAGISADVNVLSPAQVADRANLTNYPALAMQRNHYETGPGFLTNFHSSRIATEATRYVGANRGAFHNADLDRLVDLELTSLDLDAIARSQVESARIVSEQIPGIPLYGTVTIDAYPSALQGPGPVATDVSLTWNIHQWEWVR